MTLPCDIEFYAFTFGNEGIANQFQVVTRRNIGFPQTIQKKLNLKSRSRTNQIGLYLFLMLLYNFQKCSQRKSQKMKVFSRNAENCCRWNESGITKT